MDFAIALDPHSPDPVYQQIYAALRVGILNGWLAPRQRLPSTRALAQSLEVSRATVTQSYDQLLSEGYLQTVTGSGTYVCDQLPDDLLQPPPLTAIPAGPIPAVSLSAYGRRLEQIDPGPSPEPAVALSFRYGRPALDRFPLELWRQLLSRHCRRTEWLDYATNPLGYGPLREAIAAYLAQARAVHCHPDQILITNGTQQALSLATRLLLSPGDRVALEEPSYLSARRVLASQGATLCPIPVDAAGMDVAALAATPGPIRLMYVTPSHQFPTGAVLSLPRRLALLAWAEHSGSLIFEDDYDSEYRYGGRPIPALQGLGDGQSVLYVGTFSKVLFPSLRVGYMVLPPALVPVFSRAKWLADRQGPTLEQAVLADFITEGHLERHIRRMRGIYDRRRQTLVAALSEHWGDRATLLGENAGLHVMVRFAIDIADEELMAKAADVGIGLISASPQYLGPSPGHEFIFSYTELEEDAIALGLERLAALNLI
ncbi:MULTISPECIES: PLP-dependent aminotransferase family protein [Cyanophyceae]|uniref:MocR-like pyridoxine biosynthesis transcription factor PdxR n=1 Tax=Cyanophyceae TaxID=3028117 RepID=UPI00168A2A19|nr:MULTISPECIES: PLP-dependent aminotransferase family protein [Cyanophyceae]MBD1918225.1 PLP-dependent aminotransferase family protein [Phormidium sp. FACHB-77]MBD2030257.1 PLP-dependent aminotransferase family protein [Phormidium sp. FACHB-322]MBD2051371.1 PLP-dependent aminotransferase family protein [Leptolyngbya sp. FACHB-60]